MLTPLLALALMQAPAPVIPDNQKGLWLFHACQGAIRWMDAPRSSKPSEDDQNFDNCTAYIGGYIEGVTPLVCITEDSSMSTYARLYVQYMQKHPMMLDTLRSLGLEAALREAYPCRKPK